MAHDIEAFRRRGLGVEGLLQRDGIRLQGAQPIGDMRRVRESGPSNGLIQVVGRSFIPFHVATILS